MTTLREDRPLPGVLRLTLDGEETLNALDAEAKESLADTLRRIRIDRETRVVLITGAGRAFCSGGDIRGMGPRTTLDSVDRLTLGREIVESLQLLRKPVIAAVNGVAAGAGFNLALAADIIIAKADAYFQASFVRVGLLPDFGGTYQLTRQVGLLRAKEILLSARKVSAAEAHSLGIAAHVYDEGFQEHVLAYAERLARSAPAALGLTKMLVNRASEGSLSEALDREVLGQAVLSQTRDHRTAVTAFLTKQPHQSLEFEGS